MVACSGTKRLEKAVKKVGAKESLDYITKEYPELFNNRVEDIIIFNTDTVYVPEKDGTIVEPIIVHDTIFFKDSNIDIKINKNTGKGTYKLPSKSIIEHDTIRIPVTFKCPDVAIANEKYTKLEFKYLKYKNNTTITIIVLSFLLVV